MNQSQKSKQRVLVKKTDKSTREAAQKDLKKTKGEPSLYNLDNQEGKKQK